MRLKSEIWIKAYIRRVQVTGSAAYVMRRGDGDAGAIFIVVSAREGASLFVPALALDAPDGERRWTRRVAAAPGSRDEAERVIAREAGFDPDLWVIEVEDLEGRHFLADEIAQD